MNQRVREVLQGVIEQFQSGSIPEAISMSMFPYCDIPSEKWSLLNRLLMFLSGTMDARGFQQWKEAKRHVKKGSKSLYIMVPYIKKVDEGANEKQLLTGFGLKSVFRVEDTEGNALDYQRLQIGEMPLKEKAEEWGITVKALPGNYSFYGFYSSSQNEIALATPEESVFFHELAHCAHDKVVGGLKAGQDPLQEIVAELSAAALCRMVGKQSDTLGNSYRYIERYANKVNMSPHMACLKVMAETEKVLNLILDNKGVMS